MLCCVVICTVLSCLLLVLATGSWLLLPLSSGPEGAPLLSQAPTSLSSLFPRIRTDPGCGCDSPEFYCDSEAFAPSGVSLRYTNSYTKRKSAALPCHPRLPLALMRNRHVGSTHISDTTPPWWPATIEKGTVDRDPRCSFLRS